MADLPRADESMRLKDVVYHDFSEFNPMNFLGTAYIRSKVMESSYGKEILLI